MAYLRSTNRAGGFQLAVVFALLGPALAAGCGGGKSAGAIGCTDPLMIDDMEDGDGFICNSGGRHGPWYTVGDGTSSNLAPPSGGTFTQTLIPGGRGTSRYAARLTGFGFTDWGAAMGLSLNATGQGAGQGAEPYDASGTQGVQFWMMSNVPVYINFPLADTLPATEAAGGTCVDARTEWNCDNDFTFTVTAPQPGVWAEYQVPYAAARQGSYRFDAAGNPIRGTRTFDPAQLVNIQFNVDPDQTFDVWIDDLSFYTCETSDCLPTCTDPAAPVSCPAAAGVPAHCWPTGTDCSTVLYFAVQSISGTGPSDAWAVGYQGAQASGAIAHWNGTAWSFVPSGTPYALDGVWSSTAEDAWAVGSNATILHWDGSSWSPIASGTTHPLGAVWGSGSSDVWAVGASGTILHWNGSAWSSVTSGTSYALVNVWGTGSNDVWAIGFAGYIGDATGGGIILHWDGAAWSAVSTGAPVPLVGLWGSAPADVWVVGEGGTILHWNGAAWSSVPSGTTHFLRKLWGSGPDDVWAVGGDGPSTGTVLHWNGTAWSTVVGDNPQPLDAVWGSGSGDVWAGGAWANTVHWDGTTWSAVPVAGPLQ
jgi:hypothetical protein